MFTDGFDHYTTNADMIKKWDSAGSAPVAATGRYLSGAYSPGTTGAFKNFAASATVRVQFALKVTFGSNQNIQICRLTAPGENTSTVTLENDGSIRYYRGDTAGTRIDSGLAAHGGGTVAGGTFHYFEIEQVISATVGTCLIKLNGTTIVNLTGLNNKGGASNPSSVGIGGHSSWTTTYDDFLLMTGADAAPFNALIGDWSIATLFPNGVGTTTNFTPLAGANWTNVDDATPDDDTTYVQSTALNDKDTYTFTNLPAGVTAVKGVMINCWAEKTEAGSRNIGLVTLSSGTEAISADKTLTSAYYDHQAMQQTDPNTTADWAPAAVDAAEFGQKVTL